MEPELYSTATFCARFGIGKTKFWEEVKAGRLRVVRLGRTVRVKRADALAWVDSLPTATAAAA